MVDMLLNTAILTSLNKFSEMASHNNSEQSSNTDVGFEASLRASALGLISISLSVKVMYLFKPYALRSTF